MISPYLEKDQRNLCDYLNSQPLKKLNDFELKELCESRYATLRRLETNSGAYTSSRTIKEIHIARDAWKAALYEIEERKAKR